MQCTLVALDTIGDIPILTLDTPDPFLSLCSYKGTTDLQLERINVYYNEASGT